MLGIDSVLKAFDANAESHCSVFDLNEYARDGLHNPRGKRRGA